MAQAKPAPVALDEAAAPSGTVSDCPSLAPNVSLSGEMQESGFSEQQWLVQRNGQFIQLTELLYRLLEQIDGEHSLQDVARGMSESTGRNVSAENVRQLLENKLVPLGLVTRPDGTVATPDGATQEGASRSPLQINMRTTVVQPAVINPITAVLKIFYWPPVLLTVLAVSAVAQGWLFFVHGIAGSVHQVLYKPGLMLAILGIIILSAAFHEFGHASALRYGGGEVRGMGVGLYLVYPAFYTDVTDNYRLGRWSRIRTDLGGFYFNLIFGLAAMAIYAITRQEFFLLAVLLVDLEIIHQTLPFVRLDGYWALADLTGLPDFFSQIVPFLRTIFPFLGRDGRTLQDLKGWVKAVFAIYILVTIPLLLFLLFLMVTSVPRVLATAWDSIGKQGHALNTAQSSGDVLGMALAAVQILLLALPVFGMCYVLLTLARRLLIGLWHWSKPTPARRVSGIVIALCGLALIGYLWAPKLPSGHGAGPLYGALQFRPIQANERGTIGDVLRQISPASLRIGPKKPAVVEFPAPVTHATPRAAATAASTATLTATAATVATPTTVPATAPAVGTTPTVAPVPTATQLTAPVPPSVPPTPVATQQPTLAPTNAP